MFFVGFSVFFFSVFVLRILLKSFISTMNWKSGNLIFGCRGNDPHIVVYISETNVPSHVTCLSHKCCVEHLWENDVMFLEKKNQSLVARKIVKGSLTCYIGVIKASQIGIGIKYFENKLVQVINPFNSPDCWVDGDRLKPDYEENNG